MPCTSSNSNAYVTFWESPPSRSRTCELATASSRSGTPPGSDRCHVGPFTRHRRGPGVLIRSARARPAPMKVRLWPRQQRHCPSDAPRARCGGARRSRSGGAVRNQRGHHHCRHGGITAGQWAPGDHRLPSWHFRRIHGQGHAGTGSVKEVDFRAINRLGGAPLPRVWHLVGLILVERAAH